LDFISIYKTLAGIANDVAVPHAFSDKPKDLEIWRSSEAAKTLYERLHNASDTRPRWVEVHSAIGRPLFNEDVASEGMEILMHIAGWYGRETKERLDHIMFCVKAGLDPDIEPPITDPRSGMFKYFPRENEIGFDRSELAKFLNVGDVHSASSLIAAQDEASEILACERAIPDDIAWAWTTLIDIQNGESLQHNERRYRKIADTLDWIKALNLQTSTEDGLPSKSRSRDPVVPGEDIRGRFMVRLAAVRNAALAEHLPWPVTGSATANALPMPPTDRPPVSQPPAGRETTTHKIKARASALDAEIQEAKKRALDNADPKNVFSELVKMAEEKVGCLLGLDGKDIKYQSGDDVKFFKMRSLRERMKRAATY
jgi:hypothetical protein